MITIKKRVVLPTILCFIVSGILLYLTSEIFVSAVQLKKLSEYSDKLTIINMKNTKREYKLKLQLADKSSEIKTKENIIAFIKIRESRLLKINIILDYYKKCGQAQVHSYATSESMLQYLVWFEKYGYLTKGFNFDTFKPEDFFLLWGTNETHWNPKGYHENKIDGKIILDVGLMQIMEHNWHLLKEVNKITGHNWNINDIKTNPECSIAVWCYWLGNHSQKGVWGYYGGFRKEVHNIYWKITGIKYE